MATGFKVGGTTDLDDLFLPLEGTKRSNVGFKTGPAGGSDVSNRWEPYTTGTKAITTGYKAGATDLNDLFQNIAVPLESISFPTSPWNISTTDLPTAPECGFELQNDGDTLATTPGGIWSASDANDWLSTAPSGNGAGYEYWYSVSGSALSSPPPGAGTDNWTTLGTTRRFKLAAFAGTRDTTVTIRIRPNGDSGGTVTRSITLQQTAV